MSNSIESITTAALSLALDAASARQQVIANNIANANTEGFVPHALDFEGQLEQARRALRERGRLDEAALRDMKFRQQPVLRIDGQPARVELDVEVGNMARNAVQYQALVKGLSRHLSMLSSAATEGKK
jgi:flagellar basal-body rod protein FlgB